MTTLAALETPPHSFRRGVSLALLAAIAFGITTPLIRSLGKGAGAAPAAALLYAGAALASVDVFWRSECNEAPVRLQHLPRLFCVALIGAVFAPLCLTWGLQRTSATSASLLLNFEAVFTVALAWAIHHEAIGRRVVSAVCAMALGGLLLVASEAKGGGRFGVGGVAVFFATLGWALDNTLSRPLAELSPSQVVKWKGAIGAASSLVIALLSSQPFPKLLPLLGLLACGATGYGLSLRLYLNAQRKIGAARTGSIFAVAPFLGAAVAWALGERAAGAWSVVAAALFALGVYLHLTEKARFAERARAAEARAPIPARRIPRSRP